MIMEEWKEYKLGEICGLVPGFAFKSKDFGSGKDCAIKIKDIRPPYVETKEADSVDVSKYDKDRLAKFNVHKGEFLLAMTGATIGKIGRYIDEKPAYVNQRVLKFVDIGKVSYDYLYYFLLTDTFQIFVNNHIDSQSAQPNISANTIGKYIVNLPSIKEQRRIASILSSLDSKIEINRRINANLEQQAQALFKSWFVDFEPFKDGEFMESELGRIPKGWRAGCLDELCCFISRGITPKYDETSDELILGQTCVRNNIVTLNNARKHRPKTKNDKWVQQWDVLLNSTGIGSLGRVGIVYFNMDNVAIDSHITVVRTSCPLYRHYVGRNLLSRQLEIENMAVGSTGQTELPRDRVKAMPIIIPSHETMDKFNAIIEPMAISMYSNIIESRRLAEMRDTLLPKLMSGELKVNDISL